MSSTHRPHSQRTERDETNTSILKNKKIGADAVQLKKNALTQEFKELYRERNVKVAEERDEIPKPKEHKLRQALDSLLGENKRRDTRLTELQLRLNIMRRDDISGIEPSEKSVEQRFNRSVGSDSARKISRYEPGSESKMRDGRDLVDRFAYVKQTLETILNRKEEEEEINKMLDKKINELLKDNKVVTDRIGKKEALYEMMEKRFLNLGNTEFAAKNKLTRTSNKLLSFRKEIEKQKSHEDDYFNQKRTAFKRTQSTVEGLKDTISRNLIYLEEIRLKKDEVDEKLEEVNYEEKQIINKRQASEYILLYIDLLESLEKEYLEKKTTPPKTQKSLKGPKLNYDISPKDKEKPKSLISAGTEETPRKISEPSRPGSQTIDFDKKGQNSSDTTRDRDVIITRIAQFYDQHPSGTNALVQTLLKIYHEMLLNEQSLSIRHQDLNHERLERQAEIEELEKGLSALQQGFILMEEKDDNEEEASPEHVRETERKVVGKLGQYDYKTVKLGEYLVNLCATGIQDTISKLSKASCSLVVKSGKRISGELGGRAKEIEASLTYPKSDFSVPELQGRTRSISKAEDSGRDTSISVRPRTISLSTSSPKESVINLQNLRPPEQIEERKDTSSKSEEAGKILFSQQTISGGSEEFNKVEQLFRSCVPGASPELVYKWNEKVFESKWMLDYLTKEDVKRIVNKYTYYYGNDISDELLKSILRDLKNEARLTQRKRTSDAFNMTEELLTLFLKHYQAKKNEMRKRFDTEIRSEVLDDLNQVLAVSEHVEKAHNARYQNLFSEQQTEETDVWRKVEDPHDSESEMELVSLRAKTPEIKNMKTTREAIAELHNHYLKERRGLGSHQGRRSNSAPKFKVVVSKTIKESFDSSDNEENESQKGSRLQLGKTGSVHDDKKDMVIDSSMTRKKDSSSARRNSRASTEIEGEATEEDRDAVKKSIVKKVSLAPIPKEKKVYPIPQAFYKAQQKQRNVEEFKKKLIKDDEILRKIALLEKRQTGFDKKSKDYDKRRDYVPNFSLLEKFDLNREKKRDQIIQEWWKRQEAGILDTTNRERSSTPFLISSSRKDERQSLQFDPQTDSSRNVIVSQKRRSVSKSTAKPWTLPEEPVAQTSRPGTSSQGRRSSRMRRDSFDDLENKLFKEAVSQNRASMSEIEKL